METRRELVTHCALHTVVSASPSFLIAYMSDWTHTSQIIGMCLGVLVFLGVAIFLHLTGPFCRLREAQIAGPVVRWAKNIRMLQAVLTFGMWSLLSVPLQFPKAHVLDGIGWWLLESKPLLFALQRVLGVDVMAGMLAVGFVERVFGLSVPATSPEMLEQRSIFVLFSQAFLSTFIEGLILASFLAVFIVVLYLIVKMLVFLRNQFFAAI